MTDCYKGFKLLLAEDIEVSREIVLSLLEPTGIEVHCAEDGQKAVAMFAAAPEDYDAILMDLGMPGMDGLTATRKIREMNIEKAKKIPIIAMTANAFQEDIDACISAGMTDHLGKPFDDEQMFEKLRKHIKNA